MKSRVHCPSVGLAYEAPAAKVFVFLAENGLCAGSNERLVDSEDDIDWD
ncbi:MAG: hypothetical protein J1D85_03745 [Bacteroidales bacterium]|nr:hypothetical protein [Bacteroidales bacterium]